MKFCTECGTKRIENSKFCGDCGFKFSSDLDKRQEKEKVIANFQTPSEEFKKIYETRVYYELLEYLEKTYKGMNSGYIKLLSHSIHCNYGNLGKYREVMDEIKSHFGINSEGCYDRIAEFFKSELIRVYGIGFEGNLRKDKLHDVKKQSRDSFLDGAELVLDLLSPVSAAKRVIKELKKY